MSVQLNFSTLQLAMSFPITFVPFHGPSISFHFTFTPFPIRSSSFSFLRRASPTVFMSLHIRAMCFRLRSNIAYTNARCKWVSKTVRSNLGKTNKYEIGEHVICRVYKKDMGQVFNVNITYEIISIDDWKVETQDIKNKTIFMTNTTTSLPVLSTAFNMFPFLSVSFRCFSIPLDVFSFLYLAFLSDSFAFPPAPFHFFSIHA